jgi:hypothetical protein
MIGELPYQFKSQSVNIYSINESKQFIPQLVSQTIFPPNPDNSTVMLNKTTPQPTPVPTSTSPTVYQPSNEPILPSLSINIVYDNPLLYALVLFSMVVTLGFAFGSVKKPKIKPTKTAISPTTKPA